jgi:oxygen-independent coproporphyrinogen-3 oxidase
MKYGIYLHIPFCRAKCHYCDFYSVPLSPADRDGALPGAYAARLEAELGERLAECAGDTADTLYFGGGTPSLLPPAVVGSIIRAAGKWMPIESGAEITLEMNPEDAVSGRILAFADAGVTRLVIGYQTSRRGFHALIGRSTALPDGEVLDTFFGTGSLERGIDVMTGLPGQDPEDAAAEIDFVAGYRPHHISVYCLTVERGTELGRSFTPPADFGLRQRECLEAVMDRLGARGYRHYEISNFSLPGHESRHNIKYWTFRPYLGFGPRAHSFHHGERYSNNLTVDQYCAARRIELVRDERTPRDRAVEYIMTGLRMMDGISLRGLSGSAGHDFTDAQWDRARSLKSRGLLEIRDGAAGDTVLALTGEGMFLSNAVVYELVEVLM